MNMPTKPQTLKTVETKESTPADPKQPIKTSVNLPPEAVEALREIAEDRGTTVADVIRRAIWLEKYFHDATRKGGKVLVEDENQRLKEVVIR